MALLANAKAGAVPTSLGSRQWSATTFAAGVGAVAMDSKQEPWSDDEDDAALLSKIQVGLIWIFLMVLKGLVSISPIFRCFE